jgi:DNA polymerase-3 subunit delta
VTAVLVVGADEFLVARQVSAAVRAADPDGAAGTVELAVGDAEPAMLAELTSPSLFGQPQVLVLRDLHDAGKELAAAVVAAVEEGNGESMVLTHAGGAKGKAIPDQLKAAGATVVRVEAPRSLRDREQWAVDEAARHGGSIDRDAVTELLAALGGDLREIATVIEQLVADAGPRVGADAVTTYHRGRAELTGFTVADRAVEGHVAAALEAVRWALETGTEPVLVNAALAANLRLIGLVAGSRGGSPEQLAGPLRQPPWKIRRAQSWLRRWRPEALAEAARAVALADAEVKGSGDDARYAVERAVLAVASACA